MRKLQLIIDPLGSEILCIFSYHGVSSFFGNAHINPGSSDGKGSACNSGDPGLIPGLGRSSGEGNGYPLHYSGLENSMDSIVHGVAKSWIQLSDFHIYIYLTHI